MKRLLLVAAAAAALITPDAAQAQSGPDREIQLSQTSFVGSWEGKKGSGNGVLYSPAASRCTGQDPYFCDNTLISVSGGPTPLAVETAKVKGQDFDLHVYESNAEGVPLVSVGSSIGEGDTAEKVIVDGASGFYLVSIHYWAVENASPLGKATLTAFAPKSSPAPAPAPEPGPSPQPGTSPAPASFDFKAQFGKAKLKAARSKGFPATIACSSACKGTAQISVDAKTAKKFKLGKKATVIGKVAFNKPAGTHALVLKLSAKAKKALKKAKSLKLTLSASATSGSISKTATATGSFKG